MRNPKSGAVGLVPSNYVNVVNVTMLGSTSRQASNVADQAPASSGPEYGMFLSSDTD